MYYNLLLLDAVIGFEKLYTYESEERLQKGQIVFVPFSTYKRPMQAIVISEVIHYEGISRRIAYLSEEKLSSDQLDVLLDFCRERILSPAHFLRLHFPKNRRKTSLEYEWITEEENISLSEALEKGKVILIPKNKKKKLVRKLLATKEEVEEYLSSLPKRNRKVPQYLEEIAEKGSVFHKGSLSAKQYEELISKRLIKESIYNPFLEFRAEKKSFLLREEQKQVLENIKTHEKYLHFLQGIAGSGKTQLSFELAREALEQGKKVIYLVPNHFQIPQIAGRLAQTLEKGVTVLSNLMKESEIQANLEEFHRGKTPILVGTYTCLFTDISQVGALIMDESHDDAYQSIYPYFDTREYCKRLGEKFCIKTLFLSATPRMEDYLDERFVFHQLYYELEEGEKEMICVDMKKELMEGNLSYLSKPLQKAVKEGKKALLLLNQSGYYSYVGCRSCGFVMKCPTCEKVLSYEKDRKLHCRNCSYETFLPKECPSCHSAYFKFFHAGVKKLQETLEELFPDKKILSIEGSELKNWQQLYERVNDLLQGDYSIVIGTHLIGKTLDMAFDVVGAVSFDSSLYSPEYRALETSFQSLIHLLGRGARASSSKVYLQTYTPEFSFFEFVKNQDYKGFMQEEVEFRKRNQLPPFVRYVLFQTRGKDFVKNREILQTLENILSPLPVKTSLYPGRVHGTQNLLVVMKEFEEEYQELFMNWLRKYRDLHIFVDPLEIHL